MQLTKEEYELIYMTLCKRRAALCIVGDRKMNVDETLLVRQIDALLEKMRNNKDEMVSTKLEDQLIRIKAHLGKLSVHCTTSSIEYVILDDIYHALKAVNEGMKQ